MTHLLGHGQQLCEISSRSNIEVRSYGPDSFWVGVHCDIHFGDMTLS